ncbi:hypothetical protein ACFL4W_01435 [Planctomycetota bacterium]
MRLFAIMVLLVCWCLQAQAQEKPLFMISDFNTEAEIKKIQGGDSGNVTLTIGPRTVTEMNSVLKMVAKGGSYPGIVFYPPAIPKDWSSYEVIAFTIWSPVDTTILIRIDDEKSFNYNSRYNTDRRIQKGRSLVQIPIKNLRKSIDPSIIKTMILFLGNPPPGQTLWFDDLLLGPEQTAEVDFIPYEERYDLISSMDLVTPHLPMARNLAGGALKAFMITGVGPGREVVEMKQRMDLDVSQLTWDRNWDVNTWGFGDFYSKRGHIGDCVLMQKYLDSTMQGPEKFEAMMLFTPWGWNRFSQSARERIIKRVKEDGEGIVLMMPFTGEKQSNAWPEDLKELSALINSHSDWVNDSGWLKWTNEGRIWSKPWVKVKDHPILNGVPLESLPFQHMETQKYELAPGAEVLLQLESGEPLMAVKQLGKGRVVTFAARSLSLTPVFRVPQDFPNQLPHRFWEAWYSLANRSLMWAAKREFKREGDPVELKADGIHADPSYTVKQWKDAAGKVTDWELVYTDAEKDIQKIEIKAPEAVKAGKAIPFSIISNLQVDDWTVTLQEKLNGRWRTLDSSAKNDAIISKEITEAGVLGATLQTERVRGYMAFITVEGKKDGKVVARGKAEVIVTPPPVWDDYETFTWLGGGLSVVFEQEAQLMRDFGLTGNSGSAGNAKSTKQLFRENMRVHPIGFASGMHVRNFSESVKAYGTTKDKKHLVRTPSFADPAFLKKEGDKARGWAAAYKPYAPLSLILADETSLTSYGAEFDFDFHPENIKNFRKALENEFKTIAACNAALGTELVSFDAVEPPTAEEARKSGKWGLWAEWRKHNDNMWTGAFQMYADVLKEGYPESRCSVSGTQTSGVFNGIDWAKLTPILTAISGYGGRFQELKRLSFFQGDQKVAPWGAYGRHGRAVDYQLWESLVTGADGRALFWWFSLRDADLSLSKSGADYQRVFKELESGTGRQYMMSTRTFSLVAMLWSVNSQRAAWTKKTYAEFTKTEAAIVKGLQAAEYDPFFISEAQIEAGALADKKVKALFLPMSLSLSAKARTALKFFVSSGGKIISSHTPEFNEYMQPTELAAAIKDSLVPLDSIKDNLVSALSGYGIKPKAAVSRGDGSKVKDVFTTVHRIPGEPTANLITLLRPPVGTKDVVGGDGVIHSVPDASGGKELESVQIDIAAFGDSHFYDLRAGKELKAVDGKLTIDLQAGGGHPIAALAYPIEGLRAKHVIEDRLLKISTALVSDADQVATHVIRIEAADQAGTILFSANVNSKTDGTAGIEFPLALEDEDVEFTVTVRDILTGQTAKSEKPGSGPALEPQCGGGVKAEPAKAGPPGTPDAPAAAVKKDEPQAREAVPSPSRKKGCGGGAVSFFSLLAIAGWLGLKRK